MSHACRLLLPIATMIAALLALVLVAILPAEAAAPPATVYVATGGSNSASGTSAKPVRTISHAIRKVAQGGIVLVRPGTYHESLTIRKPNITVRAASSRGRVWLDGTRKVGSWQRSGSVWVAKGWTVRFDRSPTFTRGAPDNSSAHWRFINPDHPLAAYPDQVWLGGQRLRQVAKESDVKRGTFAVDYARSRLYVGSNPHGKTVRASDLSRAMRIVAPDVKVGGINVRRYGTAVPDMGSVTVERPRATLVNMRIVESATSGLQVGAADVHLRSILLSANGMMGLRGSRADRLRIESVRVIGNNTEHFNHAPSAGGAKVGRMRDVRVRDSVFRNNDGTGLWMDESVYRTRIVNSRFTTNKGHGIALEISGTALVANNVIGDNRRYGLKINNTDKVDVWNNTFARGGRPIYIAQDRRDVDLGRSYRDWSMPLTLVSKHIKIRNNVIADPSPAANCLLCVEDHSHRWSARQLDITARGNVYHRRSASAPRWLVVWSRGPGNPEAFRSLSDFKKSTGQETGRMIRGGAPVTAAYRLRPAVYALNKFADPLPASVANVIGKKVGVRKVGSWK